MKMQFQMQLEQSQKLIMTPTLRQAIEILQYNTLELHQHITIEMLENPMLEYVNLQPEDTFLNSKSEKVEIDWKTVAKEYTVRDSQYTYTNNGEKEGFCLENIIASEESLHDHLLFQLQFTLLDKKEYTLGEYIIQNILSTGYLVIDPDYVTNKFNISKDMLEEVIQTIQTFEPYGVGARDIQECLSIQVQMNNIDNPIVIKIIDSHIDALANNKLKEMAKALNVSCEEVQSACDIIKSFDPKPGLKYSSTRNTRYIIPDVEIRRDENNQYFILVNDSSAPKLNISQYYKNLLAQEQLDPATFDYINGKLNRALRLIKSIEQRRSTIYKVVSAILEYQKDFFEKGKMFLKVLNLKHVADHIGMHESTVSRAINGKYLQTPKGIYELKYFFQSGVTSYHGDGISAESIKLIIKELIDKENPQKPISDQLIANKINAIGVKVSRRTIAKYRESMQILGSSKRKRY